MFSVVVPVWNKRATLRRTIEQALKQTYSDFELIVVDDGSTDGSLAALEGLVDPRLRVVQQANSGPGAARNRGIREARHAWIAFLDADDLWFEGHLAELHRVRKVFPRAGLIGTSFITSDQRGTFRRPSRPAGKVEAIDYLDRVAAGEAVLCASSAAAPRALLLELGGFGPFARGEDSELWVRIALDHEVARSTVQTSVYVRGTNGITDRIPKAWGDGVPRCVNDLSPAVATVLDRYDRASSHQRKAAERFVERYLGWALQSAVYAGDLATMRALGRLARRPPPLLQRTVLAVARLPAPFAVALSRMVLRLDRLRKPPS